MLRSSPVPQPPAINPVAPVTTPARLATVQSSLALAALTGLLRGAQKLNVLDFGPACRENIEFFSNYLCKLYIADVHAGLTAPPADVQSGTEPAPAPDFEHILRYPPATRFDIILSWDLFNYFSREQLHALAQQLGPFCNPGALLFSIISGAPEVPQQPLRFRLMEEASLSSVEVCAATRPNARYRETNIARLLPGFRAHKTFLLRNGVQECLFSYA